MPKGSTRSRGGAARCRPSSNSRWARSSNGTNRTSSWKGSSKGPSRGADLALSYLHSNLRWTGNEVPGVFQRLPQIGFSGVITTNFDDLLERSFSIPPGGIHTLADTGRLLEALSKNEFFLLKLYGDLERPDSVILTSARSRDAVIGNELFGQFLKSLFYSRTLLFAGKSLQGIEEFLGSVPSRSGAPPRHFAAVLDTEEGLDVKTSSLMRRFGIDVIPCGAGTSGSAVGDFIGLLADQVEKAKGGTTATVPPVQPRTARLTRVALENIGPFERLEIDLAPGWTLLLGDNGVGKSSVLKTIAVAIVGDEAALFASRLVRAGATSAAVTLVTDRGESAPDRGAFPDRARRSGGRRCSSISSTATARTASAASSTEASAPSSTIVRRVRCSARPTIRDTTGSPTRRRTTSQRATDAIPQNRTSSRSPLVPRELRRPVGKRPKALSCSIPTFSRTHRIYDHIVFTAASSGKVGPVAKGVSEMGKESVERLRLNRADLLTSRLHEQEQAASEYLLQRRMGMQPPPVVEQLKAGKRPFSAAALAAVQFVEKGFPSLG